MKEQRQKDAERMSMNRANETSEETQKRRHMDAERASINRANESPEKGNERKETHAKRMKVNRFNSRVNQSPEKAKELKEKAAERVRKYRLNKKAFQEARKERMRNQIVRSVNQAPVPDQGINTSNTVRMRGLTPSPIPAESPEKISSRVSVRSLSTPPKKIRMHAYARLPTRASQCEV